MFGKMKLNEGMLVYTTVYTCLMLFLGILSSLKYVFIPKIPFIPLIFLVLCIIQSVLFCIASRDGIIGLLYKVNTVIAILLILSSNTTGASELLMVYSILVVFIPSLKSYKEPYSIAAVLIAIVAKFMFSLVESGGDIGSFLLARIISILISFTCVFAPYLPISLEYVEYDRYVKVENPIGERSDSIYAEVEGLIDFGVLKAVKIGEFDKREKTTMVPIESEYSKKVSEEHVTALLRGIKANDIQKIYSMFSEEAKAFGISEYDIDRLGILRDGIYQAVDLSNLCIIDEYDYKKGRIIRSFSYRFYIKHGVYMVLIEGQQEITGSSNLIEDGMFFRVVIYPTASPEILDGDLPIYGIYVFPADTHSLGD